jgi:hypothetical protein
MRRLGILRTIRPGGVIFVVALGGALLGARPARSAQTITATASTETHTTITVLPTVLVRSDQFLTRVTAHLGANPNLYDQTFSAPFSDPAVQAAIVTATTALHGAGAVTIQGPNLLSSQTSLVGSVTVNQDATDHTTVTVTTTQYIGPMCIGTGNRDIGPSVPCPPAACGVSPPATSPSPCFGTPFSIVPGGVDIDTLTHTEIFVNRVPTQTDTFLTQTHYDLLGEQSIEQVPVPALGTGGLAALGGLLVAAALIALRARS